MKKVFTETTAAILILVFIYTGVTKTLDRATFESELLKSPYIGNYATIIAWGMPFMEILTAILLVVKKTRLLGLYASFTLMLLFAEYVEAMLRYSDYLPCSCGGIISELSWSAHLFFNSALAVLTTAAIGINSRQEGNRGLLEYDKTCSRST